MRKMLWGGLGVLILVAVAGGVTGQYDPVLPPPQAPDGFRQIDPEPDEYAPTFFRNQQEAEDDNPTEWVDGFTSVTIPPNDTAALLSAVAAANAARTTLYVFYVMPGTYILNAPIVIDSSITYVGVDSTGLFPADEGVVTFKMEATGSGGRIFTVQPGAALILHNVTLKKGRASSQQYYGGAIYAGGTVEIYNSKLSNNSTQYLGTSTNYGGAVFVASTGSLTMSNVILKNNTSGYGGAIASIAGAVKVKKGDYGLRVTCLSLKENSTLADGGAVYGSVSDAVDIKRAIYYGNYSPAYEAILNNTPVETIIAKKGSWYQTIDVSAGVDASAPQLLPVPYPNVEEHTDCGVPQPPSEAERIRLQLLHYGIEIYHDGIPALRPDGQPWGQADGQPWTIEELRELKRAVELTASAFNRLKYNKTSGVSLQARNLFKNVIKHQTSSANLLILRVRNSFRIKPSSTPSDEVDGCDPNPYTGGSGSSDEGCTSNNFNLIALYGNFHLSVPSDAHYTIIHELGHRFDNQSGTGGGTSLFNRADQTNVILDCRNVRVMGYAAGGSDYARGVRGWGSPGRSQFQQNLTDTPTGSQFDDVSEAVADMFLNWVYRRITDAMPSGNPADACSTRAEVGTWLGFRNIDGNGAYEVIEGTATLPGNRRYWWMEVQMKAVFDQHLSTWQ